MALDTANIMSDELDDFLRQAAQRRQQRQQQRAQGGKAAPANPAEQPQTRSQRSAPPPVTPSLSSANPSTPDANARTGTPIPKVRTLEPTLANRHVESDLSYADERMEGHIKEVFRSEGSFKPLSDSSGRSSDFSASSNYSPADNKASSESPTGAPASKAMVSSGDLIFQLRHPQTLRLAIIAHEVLRRPYP